MTLHNYRLNKIWEYLNYFLLGFKEKYLQQTLVKVFIKVTFNGIDIKYTKQWLDVTEFQNRSYKVKRIIQTL